jgi:Ca2+/Na+ antiporter
VRKSPPLGILAALPGLVAGGSALVAGAMGVANALGSNVFDLLLILGAAGLARPIVVDPRIVDFEHAA